MRCWIKTITVRHHKACRLMSNSYPASWGKATMILGMDFSIRSSHLWKTLIITEMPPQLAYYAGTNLHWRTIMDSFSCIVFLWHLHLVLNMCWFTGPKCLCAKHPGLKRPCSKCPGAKHPGPQMPRCQTSGSQMSKTFGSETSSSGCKATNSKKSGYETSGCQTSRSETPGSEMSRPGCETSQSKKSVGYWDLNVLHTDILDASYPDVSHHTCSWMFHTHTLTFQTWTFRTIPGHFGHGHFAPVLLGPGCFIPIFFWLGHFAPRRFAPFLDILHRAKHLGPICPKCPDAKCPGPNSPGVKHSGPKCPGTVQNVRIQNVLVRKFRDWNVQVQVQKVWVRNIQVGIARVHNVRVQNIQVRCENVQVWNFRVRNIRVWKVWMQSTQVRNVRVWNIQVWNIQVRNVRVQNVKGTNRPCPSSLGAKHPGMKVWVQNVQVLHFWQPYWFWYDCGTS